MPNLHAKLSASGASRWMACPPSATYEQQFPEQESVYADEGTLAHAIANLLIQHKAFNIPLDKRMDEFKNDPLFNEEMWGHVNNFADYVIDKVRNTPGSIHLFLEERLDMRTWIPEGFGTSDVTMISDAALEVVDYKHGKGVPVDVYENKQLLTYALGALHEFGMLYDPKIVRVTVFQPRIDNIETYELSTSDLIRWGNEVLKPAAELAWNGEGEFEAGDHCRFCRAKALCPTNAKYNLQLAKLAFADTEVATVSDEHVVKILARASSMKRWITSVEDMALKMAIQGKVWPGMKLVAGRSIRKYTNEAEIIKGLIADGVLEEEIVNKKLAGITDLSSKITKLQYQQLVDPHVVKPPGKPTLVDENDKRPEWNANAKAKEVFD